MDGGYYVIPSSIHEAIIVNGFGMNASELNEMIENVNEFEIENEDILSIVMSHFMPCGVECDQYSVLGEIVDFNFVKNIVTDEEICVMILSCNDLQFDICINRADLYGEPAVGRRFKGTIWMQGYINFP